MIQNTQESTLRKKLNSSGKKLTPTILGWLDVIEHDLKYLLTENDIGMDIFTTEAEELLAKNDFEVLANRLQDYAKKVHIMWLIEATREQTCAKSHMMYY